MKLYGELPNGYRRPPLKVVTTFDQATITQVHGSQNWQLRIDYRGEELIYRAPVVLKLREFAERFMHRPLEWVRHATTGELWARL